MNLGKTLIIGGAVAAAAYLGKRLYDEGQAAALLDWSYVGFDFTSISTAELRGALRLKLTNPGREFTQQLRDLRLDVVRRGTVVANISQAGAVVVPGASVVVVVPVVLRNQELLREVGKIGAELLKNILTGAGLPAVLLDIRGTADVESQVLGTSARLPINLSIDVIGALKTYYKIR